MKLLIPVLSILMLFSCTDKDSTTPDEKTTDPSSQPVNQNRVVETLATQLDVPWQINIVEDTVYYLSGRPGEIIRIQEDSKETQTVDLTKDVVSETESGLLGFHIIDGSREPLEAFLYHTYEEGGRLLNRVVKVQQEGSTWKETDILIEGIPGGPIHDGGRLAVGPDEKLYITTGDAGESGLAQDRSSLAGKILRLNLDGSVPADNPFPDSPVYSYGHRNPQGIDWTEDGKMYSAEHGSTGHDEINEIVAGGNYGWPVIQGDEEQEGMIKPLFHSGENTWAPSGIAISGSKIYVAFLAGKQIREFDFAEKGSRTFADGYGRMRDVEIVDGSLYAITNNRDGRGNPEPEDDRLLKFQLKE
ncbi:PQQ-dependent sugar dehydrogenase [Pseudalkalibacillus salsuginis]|uniref:PQQ-dependent sugar dehydrogenase n=1 Tax=Pseudalkalibacillus salsuginis TaxID=2910972 RepID=UPI001F2233E5|nr:PQQ-dependent sugar dehydrogenase [Pseudalkalibacillus salsuginis]MCF6410393.1 PQQ-dependent sugar dehydrogenase [Pseudalkalibacillus salsuginis]